MIDLSTRALHWHNDEELISAAHRYMEDAIEDFYDDDNIIADLLTRLQQEKDRNEIVVEKLAVVGEAWDMLHFGCDNPDHKEAYLHAATAILPKEN
jgi:hypothetical protein